MHKFVPAAALALSMGLFATHAFADCDEGQEQAIGKALAAAANSKISPVVSGQGKQMISLDSCDASGANITAEFKYNLLAADGLYWAQGKAKLNGTTVQDVKFTSLSPNLAAASAKSGVKLASN